MNRHRRITGTVAALILTTLLAPAVFAAPQGYGGGGNPQGGPPQNGRQGWGNPQGGRRMPPPPPASAATLPVEIMTDYLKLSTEQTAQIRTITQTLRETMRPPRPQGNYGERPQPPTPEERAARDAAVRKANDAVIAVLTDAQKPRLATLIKAFDALRAGRIPPPAIGQLRLTDAQMAQIAALGTTATHEGIRALLTDAQIIVLESARPERRGGRGGGRGGQMPPGGPPPPDGGFGGPPPPPMDGGY